MENTASSINSLFVDKRLSEYRDHKDLYYFWDLFASAISSERIEKELAENNSRYYGNKAEARNTLIRKELVDGQLFAHARAEYAKITCEKILLLFRTAVSSWSEGGRKFAQTEDGIAGYRKLPLTYIGDLYAMDNIQDVEEVSEIIDSVINKIIEEFHSFEVVRACAAFYHSRPNLGKNVPIYNDCLHAITQLGTYIKESTNNETYFQNAANHIKQYRDMLDPVKEVSEDFKIFMSSSDKTASQIRHDVEDTLHQYLHTLIQFTQIQKKDTKEGVKTDINTFLRETGYTLDSLGLEVNPVYKNTMDKLMFKKSGWELVTKAKK